MFDIGFSELVMVGLIALLVIGPERLPRVARIAGFWIGKTRNMMASVKAEIAHELQAEEMRQLFKEQAGMKEFQDIIDETADSINNSIKSSLGQLPEEPAKTIKRQHEPK